jgi:site-specific DNA-methyltransferase (adenine-specific)
MKNQKKPQIRMLSVEAVTPYERNPRYNQDAVSAVAESIRRFGWKVPIVVDKDLVVVSGHTRLMAAERLGISEVPVIVADWLTEDQAKAFRLADNRTAELSTWKMTLLDEELRTLGAFDMGALGFHTPPEVIERPESEDDAGEDNERADMVRCPHCGAWSSREEARADHADR